MAERSLIQFTYSGRITDGNRSAYTLCNELCSIIGYLDIISPSVRATALGCTFSLLLNQRDFCFLTRGNNMFKLSQHGFKFPETPSNRNLCTVVYNSYYSDRQLRTCLENSIGYKHYSGNHRELNVHTITCDNHYNYFICYKRPHQALEASFNGISVGDHYIEPQELRLYKNIHVPQCMHCYKWNKHPTSRCPYRNYGKACSLCLGYHDFKQCRSYNNKQIMPVCRNCKGPHPATRNEGNDLTSRPSNYTIKSKSRSKMWEQTKPAKYYDPDSGQLVGYNPQFCYPHADKRPQQQQNYKNSSPQAVKNKKPTIIYNSKKQNSNFIPVNKKPENMSCQQKRNDSHPNAAKINRTNPHTDKINPKYTFKPINGIKPKSLQKLRQLVDSENLHLQDVPADGDCFFHAICLQTNRPKNSGSTLRQEFVKYLHSLPQKIKIDYAEKLGYNPDGPRGSEYEKVRAFYSLVHQIKKGVYAGELEAPFMAQFLKSSIIIYNSETSKPTKYGAYSKNVKLGYIADEKHYVALSSKEKQHDVVDTPVTKESENIDTPVAKESDIIDTPVVNESDIIDNKLHQMQWQIINLALLDSMGERSSFINSYHALATANNLNKVIIPDSILFKLSAPYIMSKILTKHLDEFYQELMIDKNDSNTDNEIEEKGSKTAISENTKNQDKKCRPSKGKKSKTEGEKGSSPSERDASNKNSNETKNSGVVTVESFIKKCKSKDPNSASSKIKKPKGNKCKEPTKNVSPVKINSHLDKEPNVLKEPIVVDLDKSLQEHEGRDAKVGHGCTSQELSKETPTGDSPTETISNTNSLPPQVNNSIPTQSKPLISPTNKKRLRVEIKENHIDNMHDSLALNSKKRKKTYSEEQKMELARQAINSGNLKNFSEENGVPYSTLNAWTKKYKSHNLKSDGKSHDEDFFLSQESNTSQIEVIPLTPPDEDWLHKVSSTPIKDTQLPPLKNPITTHTPMNVSIIKKPQNSSVSSPITNMGITSINLGNGINITYENSHAGMALQQDPEIVLGEAMLAPSNSLIRAAESSTMLAPIDTAIEEPKTISLE